MTDLHVETEKGMFIALHAAFAILMLVRDVLKWKASFFVLVDWQ